MAVLMAARMILIELVVMRAMYRNRTWNLISEMKARLNGPNSVER